MKKIQKLLQKNQYFANWYNDQNFSQPVNMAKIIESIVRQNNLHILVILRENNVTELWQNYEFYDDIKSTIIHLAAYYGSRDIIDLFNEGEYIFSKDSDSRNILHIAAIQGHKNLVKDLIENKQMDAYLIDSEDYDPLKLACLSGNLDVMKYLIEERKIRDNDPEDNILHLAIKNNHFDIVKYLIEEQKYSFLMENGQRQNALHIACLEGYLPIVKYLLEVVGMEDMYAIDYDNDRHKVLEKSDINDFDILFLSVISGSLKIVRYLIEEKNVTFDNTGCYNHLHIACEYGHLDIVKYLVEEHGIDYEEFTDSDSPNAAPLIAMEFGHTDIVRYFIEERGIELVIRDNNGENPLSIFNAAVENNKLDFVRFLLENYEEEIDINFYEENDRRLGTPLYIAATNGNLEMFQYLLSNGAEFYTNSLNYSILPFVFISQNTELIEFVINKIYTNYSNDINFDGRDWEDVVYDANSFNKILCKAYHSGKIDLFTRNMSLLDIDPIFKAVKNNDVEFIDYLYKTCNISLNNVRASRYISTGDNIINLVAEYGSFEVLRYLHEVCKCPVDTIDEYGDTLLYKANLNNRNHNNKKILDYLIQNGVNPDHINNYGSTALHTAVHYGIHENIKILINYTKNINVLNSRGRSIFDKFGGYSLKSKIEWIKNYFSNHKYSDSGIYQEHEAVMHINILKTFAESNILLSDKSNALHFIAKHNIPELVSCFINDCKVDVNHKNIKGETALYLAFKLGHNKIIESLLENTDQAVLYDEKPVANFESTHNQQILFYACQSGDINSYFHAYKLWTGLNSFNYEQFRFFSSKFYLYSKRSNTIKNNSELDLFLSKIYCDYQNDNSYMPFQYKIIKPSKVVSNINEIGKFMYKFFISHSKWGDFINTQNCQLFTVLEECMIGKYFKQTCPRNLYSYYLHNNYTASIGLKINTLKFFIFMTNNHQYKDLIKAVLLDNISLEKGHQDSICLDQENIYIQFNKIIKKHSLFLKGVSTDPNICYTKNGAHNSEKVVRYQVNNDIQQKINEFAFYEGNFLLELDSLICANHQIDKNTPLDGILEFSKELVIDSFLNIDAFFNA